MEDIINFYRGNLIITREALFNYGWKKEHTEVDDVKWNSDEKTIIIHDVTGQDYIIEWDEISERIPIELPDVSKITFVYWNSDREYIGIRFESNKEEEYLKNRQPDGTIYVIYTLK